VCVCQFKKPESEQLGLCKDALASLVCVYVCACVCIGACACVYQFKTPWL